MRNYLFGFLLATTLPVFAAEPASLLKNYAAEATQADPAFRGFSAERGRLIYHTTHPAASGGTVSCAACHTADPRQPGKTRANKEILPLAPAANAERFTDPAKTEKWFRRNCQDVLQRSCTPLEKGDFLTYLMSIK